ncbi:MAG: hypothetical protein HQL88_06365 [Magnetococcales bacterium]|nr:hypothetical protein [Magnetococcales bacterium]
MNDQAERAVAQEKPPQQLALLLALAAGEASSTGECPGPEELAALLEGSFPAGRRTALLDHLDRCTACYQAWLVGAALRPAQTTRGTLLFLRRLPYGSALGGLALAASLLLMVVGWNPFAPDLPALLQVAYQTAARQPLARAESLPLLLGTTRESALGFANTDRAAPIRQAFAEGARMGWESLQGHTQPPSQPPAGNEAIYHHLGRWSVLLQSLCQTVPPPPVDLLRQQAEIGQRMVVGLTKRSAAGEAEARIPLQEVESINQLLHTPASPEPAHRLCRQIQKSCTTLSEALLL